MNRRSKVLQSSKIIKRKREKSKKLALISSICIVVIFLLIILVLRLPNLQIITINSNVKYSNDIQSKVLTLINDNYLYFIPKSNFFLYPKKLIETTLADSFKSIESISVKANGISALDINIKERVPVALACEGFNSDNKEDKDCYFIDRDGLIFTKAINTPDIVYFRYYINNSSSNELIGTNVIDKDKFLQLQNFADNSFRLGLKSKGILIDDQGQYEMYAVNADGSDLTIYFNDRISLDKISSNLTTFIEDSKNKTFESINLRFGNNIFYVNK